MEISSRVPGGLKQLVKTGVRAYTVRTSAIRMLPDYLIIGAQRAGTTSLYLYLTQHPCVAPVVIGKGVHYFDVDFAKGPGWYRGHFPVAARRLLSKVGRDMPLITGEGSPYYLFHPLVPERVAALLPEARLIALLRDPIDRAYSHYQHFVRRGIESLPTFEQALEAEPERLEGEVDRLHRDPHYRAYNHQHFSYTARGMYVDQLERWASFFPRDRILILQSELFFADPAGGYARVLDFLDLPRSRLASHRVFNTGRYDDMAPATRQRLRDLFAEPNRRLYAFLGQDYGWDAS
jgi:hypothetical protein